MRHLICLSNILLIACGLLSTAQSDIINVPYDYQQIQSALNAAEEGDTVLIAPGTYYDRFTLSKNGITLASRFILDGDEDHIISTIIDLNDRANINISGVDRSTVIRGFTIENGYGAGGGAFACSGEPTIKDCVIKDCYASSGGAIWIARWYSPQFINLTIKDNEAVNGGAIHTSRSNEYPIRLQNCIIENNQATDGMGGAISTYGGIEIDNCEFRGNVAGTRGAAIFFCGGDLTITNSIISECSFESNDQHINFGDRGAISICQGDFKFDHVLFANNDCAVITGNGMRSPIEMVNCTITGTGMDGDYNYAVFETSRLTGHTSIINSIIYNNHQLLDIWGDNDDWNVDISYSLIEDYEDEFENNYENLELDYGVIDDNPAFVNADGGDFRINYDSPCLDAGDPSSTLDPDGTTPDIGALPYFQGGYLQGYVVDYQTEVGLPGVLIASDEGFQTVTDQDGHFFLGHREGSGYNFSLTRQYYNESKLLNFDVEIGEYYDLTLTMTHPEMLIAQDSLSLPTTKGESSTVTLELTNPGEGELVWSVAPDWRRPDGAEDWDILLEGNLRELTGDQVLKSAIYHDGHYYLLGKGIYIRENGPNKIYVLDENLELINSFDQPLSDDRTGMTDLTMAGDIIWGLVDNTAYAMTLDGEIVNSWEVPEEYVQYTARYIIWDPELRLLWIASALSNAYGFKPTGELEMEIELEGRVTSGLVYCDFDDDGYYLYAYHSSDGDTYNISKYNTDTGESVEISSFRKHEYDFPKSMKVYSDWDPYAPVLLTVQDEGADLINVNLMPSETKWLNVESTSGTISANGTSEIEISMTDTRHALNFYPGKLVFTHNAPGGGFEYPVSLIIHELAVEDGIDLAMPTEFAITSIHPNPFNSTAVIQYSLPEASEMRLTVFDITGRQVADLVVGQKAAGYHTATWNGSNASAGVYFCRLQAGEQVMNRKMVLVK
ncbi:T9SS type A sorting domain-containing protein [Calditrichota bacterium]